MQFTAEQIEQIQAQIEEYEQRRDQALAAANLAQGGAVALRQLLLTQSSQQPKE